MFLETPRLYLNKITESHCTETYLSWLNDNEINKFLDAGLTNQNLENLRKFIIQCTSDSSTLFLAIHKKDDNKHIGNIKIDNIHPVHKTAEYGILFGDKLEWGKGYAREASLEVFKYCFKILKLRKITLGVVVNNIPAVNLYKKMNFKIEGVYKQHCYFDGVYMDSYRMALFKEELRMEE